ncbi:MAG TPA: hypothetical protein VI755_14820 [Anaerolineales bacterium]|nr:hypothetical protein [Anaerolineales bacterium]
MAMRSWVLPEEVYRSLHRWPKLIAYFLIGCLVGWGISFIYPPSYRSTDSLYVGLNPYRAFDDATFLALANPDYTNLDDYNNWQMSQLNAAIYLDEIIQSTLDRLQEQDDAWRSVDSVELRKMLRAEWRTAGEWNLIAEDRQPNLATQAAQTWGEVVLERINNGVKASRNAFMIDQEMQAVVSQIVKAEQRQNDYQVFMDAIRAWLSAANDLPPDEPLQPGERWQVLFLATRLAEFTPAWMALIQVQPENIATPEAYVEWLSQIMDYIDRDILTLEGQIEAFDRQRYRLKEQYDQEASYSLGLSPTLEVVGLELAPPKTVRPIGLLTIIGGILGLSLWLLLQLVRISNRV